MKGLENKIQLNLVLCNVSHVSVTMIQQLFSKSALFAHCTASSNTAFLFCRVIAHMLVVENPTLTTAPCMHR